MYLDFIQQFGMALGLSILIGFEREQSKQIEFKGYAFAGVRTFGLIGILGAIAVFISKTSPVLGLLIVAVVFALIVVAYIATAIKRGRVGLTTEVAAVVTFLIGGFAAYGENLIAVTLTLVTLAMLYFKVPLREFALHLKRNEMISTIKFMIIAFIVLPLLPNEWMGPYEIFNPYIIWLMVVFVSGISFIGYIVIKLLGERKGIGVTGFLGGLISSTALTLSFSKESKENKNIVNPYVFSVVIASVAMCVRIFFIIFVLNESLIPKLAIPFAAMAVTGLVFAGIFLFLKDKGKKGLEKIRSAYMAKSPFRLFPALKFGALFAVILLLTKLGAVYLGDRGVYAVGFLSGILDTDAVSVSLANLAKGSQEGVGILTSSSYVVAITLAVIANSIFKTGLFVFLGSEKAAKRIAIAFGAMGIAALAGLVFV